MDPKCPRVRATDANTGAAIRDVGFCVHVFPPCSGRMVREGKVNGGSYVLDVGTMNDAICEHMHDGHVGL